MWSSNVNMSYSTRPDRHDTVKPNEHLRNEKLIVLHEPH